LASIDLRSVTGSWREVATAGTLPANARSAACELIDQTIFSDIFGGDASTQFDNVFFDSALPPPTAITLDGYLSGNWYDTHQSGHVFQLESPGQNAMLLAIWYVDTPNGGAKNWIFAQGRFDTSKNSVPVRGEVSGNGAFPPLFNAAKLTHTPWGTLTFSF